MLRPVARKGKTPEKHNKTVDINDPDTGIAMKVALILRVPVEAALQAYRNIGKGWIYSDDLVMRDTPENRVKMVHRYQIVAVVDNGGAVFQYDEACLRRDEVRGIRRTERRAAIAEKADRMREEKEMEDKRRREKMFREMQGRPSPKRQGRNEKSIDDIREKYARPADNKRRLRSVDLCSLAMRSM